MTTYLAPMNLKVAVIFLNGFRQGYSMKTKLNKLMQSYYHYHTKKWTLWTHVIGIPLVTLSMFIFFGWIKVSVPTLFSLNVAWIGVIVFAIYYLCLDLLIGICATALLTVLCAIATIVTAHGPDAFSIKLFIILFILGWVFQLIGHAIEGRKPALLDNFFESVFIAPFFITAELLFMFGIKKDIEQAMKDQKLDD